MNHPTDEQIAAGLRRLGLPAPDDPEYTFHDFTGRDIEAAFREGWAAAHQQVIFCNWCPNPFTPDPRSHPNGQQAHLDPKTE